jgi:hypothetical protein
MTDLRPPRLVGNERDTLHLLMQYQRDSVVRKVAGIDDETARRRLVGSDTTLLWLVMHLTHAELLWIVTRFAGLDDPLPSNTVRPGDTLAAAVDLYVATWTRVDAIVAAATDLDVLCQNIGDGPPATLRWVLMHLLEETARHAGHADIIRELIDGATGR